MIGIFDSGIGGATVLIELKKLLPNEKYLYYSDSANFPYGDKSEEELINICDKVVMTLIEKGAKIIVIACNTASSVCRNYLRNKYKIPIVAIVPAYKMVYNLNDKSKTLVIATKATLNSESFKELFTLYNNGNTVLEECSRLADLIEENNTTEILSYLKDKLGKYKNIKNVVLGCTHYPLIKEELKEVLGNVNFFDGSRGISIQTKKILEKNNLLNNDKNGCIKFLDSNNNEEKEKLFFRILDRGEL